VQAAWVLMLQLPVAGSQQAPVGTGGGQLTALHTVPDPSQLWVQFACVLTPQLPVAGSQQAPLGKGQRIGVQSVFAPSH
jgi:hypothetical protein